MPPGSLPIPPYLHRETEKSDLQTYQTVYSKIKGSVAAPTAGLHFTSEVLADIDARGIGREEVTLHVGAGTFKPVKSDTIEGHEAHGIYLRPPQFHRTYQKQPWKYHRRRNDFRTDLGKSLLHGRDPR